MNSTKSPLPTAAHRLTSVTFNGKELVCYDYDGYGDLTAVYGSDGKKTARFRLPQRPYRRYQRIGTDGRYTYIYTGQESYEPLTQVFHNNQDEEQYLAYFHFDQIGIPCEMTDKNGNLLWFGNYTAWGRLKEETRVTDSAYQPFRHDLESPLGYA
jgi:YD repeat-containing protein